MNLRAPVLLSWLIFLGMAMPVFASQSGIVKTIQGQVRVERGNGDWELKVGDPVLEKDRVIVSGNSSVGISMDDETLISLGSNSTFEINTYNFDPITRQGRVETSILKGTLRYITGLVGKANPGAIKVSTKTATIGIRGTEFIVEVPDAK